MTVSYGPEDALYGTGRYGVARYGSVGPTKLITGVSGTISLGDTKVNLLLKPLGFTLTTVLGDPNLSGHANKTVSGYTLSGYLGELVVTAKAQQVLGGYALDADLGSITFSADANKSVSGYLLSTSLGEVAVKSINKVEVLGVSATFTLGDLTVEGGTGATEILDGFSIQSNLGTVKPNLRTFVSGVSATINLGSVGKSAKASVTPSGNSLNVDEGSVTTNAVVFDFGQFAENYSNKRTIYVPKTHVPEVA